MYYSFSSVTLYSFGQYGNLSQYQFTFFVVFILFVIARRFSRAFFGRRFAYRRILTLPILYSLFTIYLLFYVSEYEILSAVTVAAIGVYLGYIIGKKVRFFDRNDSLYYKSSLIITVLWAVSFLSRLYISTYSPNLPVQVSLLFSIILAWTAGLMVGESIRILLVFKRGGKDGQISDERNLPDDGFS